MTSCIPYSSMLSAFQPLPTTGFKAVSEYIQNGENATDRDQPVFSKHPTNTGCSQVCVTVSFHTWDSKTYLSIHAQPTSVWRFLPKDFQCDSKPCDFEYTGVVSAPGQSQQQSKWNTRNNTIHQNGICTFQLIDSGETCKETYHTWIVCEIPPYRLIKKHGRCHCRPTRC